jgi:hypothetical protein
MRKKVTAGMTLLFAAALLILAGCPQEAEEYSGDVSLSSLSVDGVTARNLPQRATSLDEWELVDFKPSDMDIAHVVFSDDAFDVDGEIKGAQIQVGVAAKTEIWYIKAAGGLKPADDDPGWTQDNIFDLKPNNSVYLQITAADKKTQVYYRLQIHQVSTDASIKALVIGGKNSGISDLDGAANPADLVPGEVNLAFGTENINARIEVSKTNAGSEVLYLRVEAGQTLDAENFSALNVYNFDDGDTVYVKVIPSDGGTPIYYGAAITSLRLSSVNIGGVTTPIPGSGAASPEAANVIDVLITTSDATTELAVVKRTGVDIEYAYVTPANSTPAYIPLPDDAEISYVDNSTLYLKAKADGFKDIYYRFAVAVKQNIATLDSITVNAGAVETLPAPGTTWGNAASVNIPLGSAVPPSITIAGVVTTGTSATVKYGYTTSNTVAPDWTASGTFSSVVSGGYVGVEVTAENGITTRYYKLRLSFGSDVAELQAVPAVYIAGVPNASNGTPRAGTWNATGTNGAIYLNNTQNAIGKSIVVYANATVSEVAYNNNASNNDTTAPSTWNLLTRDEGDPTKWKGNWAGTAIANNRRIHIRVTAQDTVTQAFYRIQVTYTAATSTLNALTINGSTVATTGRGTPAGSWNASDLVPGNFFIDTVPDPLPLTFTWQSGGTNATSYAVTSTFPPASEPTWTTGATSPLSLTGVSAGNYIWIRGVNNTNNNNSYRNIYVLRVGPPPFNLTVAGQAIPFADLFTVNAAGNTTVGGNPTPMTKVFLTEAQMATTVVAVTKGIPADTVKVIRYLIPESAGTTVTTTAQTSLFADAPQDGRTFNLNPLYPERGLPVLQIQYNNSAYYNIVPRKTADVPFTAAAPVIDGELDAAAWNNAAVLTIDRVATDTTALAAGTDRGKPATVKVLWDDTGIYYYAQVYDSEITTAGADHNADCIEFFKQENWTSTATGNNWTGQYRINAIGTLTGASTASNTTCAVKTVTGTDAGYIIEAKVTWTATDVATWSTGGSDKEIGVEFQVAYSIGSTRNICMGWNNRFGANYQQVANAGRLVLKR